MKNVYKILGQAFHMQEETVEETLNNMGMTLRGYTIYVHFEGHKKTRVTPQDVIEYYAHEARNMSSGCRTLAGITGDWRNMDECAKECLNIYKVLKRVELVKYAHKHNMELKR